MRGQTPAAHAAAILEHYNFTKADEAKFKELYGFDLRQDLTDSYSRHDNRAAHVALGNGLYKAEIVIPKELAAQIRAVKSANQQPSTLPPRSIDQTIAERKGYDSAAVLRAQIESRLPNNTPPPSGVPVPEPAPTPIKVDRIKPVSEMDSSEKVQEALTRMIPMLPESMRSKVEAMMTPEAMAAMTLMLGAWAAGHYFGVSEVIDVLAIVGLVAAGVEVVDVGQKLYDGVSLAMSAQTNEQMDAAAKKLADGLGGATVDVAAAAVLHKAGGVMEEGINNLPKMPPPSPQLATAGGFGFPAPTTTAVPATVPKLPSWITPTTAPADGLLSDKLFGNQTTAPPEGATIFESRANGYPNQRIPSSDGGWTGEVGESGWVSTKPEVVTATGGKPIPYKKGFPDFAEWSKGEVKLSKMIGDNRVDFDNADDLFAIQKKWFKSDGTPDRLRVKTMRETQRLTWHHHEDMTTMQLVPKDINNEVSHTGGASLVKRANKAAVTAKPRTKTTKP